MNAEGNSALFYASIAGNLDTVKKLLEQKGAQTIINVSNHKYQATPLLAAVSECVKLEVKNNQDRRTDYQEVINALLSAGADPKLSNNGRYTALSIAAAGSDIEMIDLLLKHQNVKDFIAEETHYHSFPLSLAIERGNYRAVNSLLDKYQTLNLEPQKQCGDTSLLIIAVRQCLENWLPKPEIKNSVVKSKYGEYFHCIKNLLERFQEIINWPDKKNCTAFYYVCLAIDRLPQKDNKDKYLGLAKLASLLSSYKARLSPIPNHILKRRNILLEKFLQDGNSARQEVSQQNQERKSLELKNSPGRIPGPSAGSLALTEFWNARYKEKQNVPVAIPSIS